MIGPDIVDFCEDAFRALPKTDKAPCAHCGKQLKPTGEPLEAIVCGQPKYFCGLLCLLEFTSQMAEA